MAFRRNKEDFVCEHCGDQVLGDGYTNHCPKCLWSKHVDIDPGDRAAACGGMMKPLGLEGSTPSYTLLHECVQCGFSRRNKVQDIDEPHAILSLAQKQAT